MAQRVLYVRQPGLLAQSLRSHSAGSTSQQNPVFPDAVFPDPDTPQPLAVASDKRVRDVCLFALARGIYPNQSLLQARRLSPTLRIVALEDVDARPVASLSRLPMPIDICKRHW